MAKEQQLAITVKKEENMSEWYTQVITKADLMDYTRVSGCIVFKPNSYQIWEKIQQFFDAKIKKSGVKNAYFPLLIPESLLTKEEEHVEGFTPEVAWVTHSGETQLNERLAVRPTSETLMYDSYSKWIQSYRDLPLRLNQWCSVVRWEFKHPTPFMRNREFLWQEGHTAYATKEEADKEVLEILDYYKDIYEELLAIPVSQGRKSIGEKFAGADYTTTVEAIAQDGKSIQAATSHHLGQNFAKAFDITFLDKNQKKQHPYQNSWGISTRSLGAMILVHSDNNGLVLPPRVAINKVVIIPLLFKGKEEAVLKKAYELKEILGDDINAIVDDRTEYSPGFKFNEWELKGIPIRIEIGPRDLENNQMVVARRDTGEKQTIKLNAKGYNLLENTCKKELPMTKREVIHCIVKHNKEDKYLCLDWKSTDWKSFVSGGIEEGETLEEAARKEILEESGYKNLKFIKELDIETYDKFYAPHKNKNRFIRSRCCVFELIDEKQDSIDKKESQQHKAVWVNKDKVKDFLNVEAVQFLWNTYLNGYDSMTGLKEIIEEKLEDIHQNLFNKAKQMMDERTIEVHNFKDFQKAIEEKKRCLVPWAESIESEDEIKEKTGAKSSCLPFKFKEKSLKGVKCFYTGKPATCWAYFAKSY